MEELEIVKYLQLMNKFQLSEQNNEELKITKEEAKLITKGNEVAKTNEKLQKLRALPIEERQKYIENFMKEKDEDVKAIKETFGFDISNIENIMLQDGVELFKFYAPKLERVVVLQNRKDKPLSEQLKEMQESNEKFQSNNDTQNTNDMLNAQRGNYNVELKMIPLSEIRNAEHEQVISNMGPDEYKKLSYLLKNADTLRIKVINLEKLIYLDIDDNLNELTYDKEKDLVESQKPVSVEVNNEPTKEILDQNDQLTNRYEEDVDKFLQLDSDIQTKTVTYYEQPDLLLNENMSDEERQQWEQYKELYKEHLNRKYTAAEMPPKQKVLTKHENGTINLIVLSIITLITMPIMLFIAYQIYK